MKSQREKKGRRHKRTKNNKQKLFYAQASVRCIDTQRHKEAKKEKLWKVTKINTKGSKRIKSRVNITG